jgi:ADP-heptose:LPS heptosyltransferase
MFKCRDYPAKLYLTDAERAVGTKARAEFGPYVLIEPYTKHENFRWSHERWEALVSACSDLTFVQHTHKDSVPVKGVHPIPASWREACCLAASCEVYVRSESGLCHAAAALGTRQVTLFGGCMDAEVMGGYPGQTCLYDDGPDSPCGSWKPCDHCRHAMDRITVADVKRAIRAHLKARKAA